MSQADVHAGDARQRARADDDPRLPHARPPARRSRSARHRAAQAITRSCTPRPTASPRPTATARSSSTTCSGSKSRPSARCSRSCSRTYCDTIGVEFMHISDPAARRPGSRSASRVRTRRSPSPARASARSSTSWSRPRASRSSSTSSSPAPSASASTAAKSLVPALEQIIKRGGALGVQDIVIGMAHRGRLNVLDAGDGQAAPRDVPRVQGRLLRPRRRRGLGRREVPSGRLVGPRVRRQQRPSVAHRQPLASRDRRSRGARQGPRQAGPARRRRRALQGAAAAACMATRPSPARAWWRNASACRA